MVLVEDGAGDALRELVRMAPEAVGGRDVAVTPWADGEDRAIVARDTDDQVTAGGRRRHGVDFVAQPSTAPELGTRGGVVGLEFTLAADLLAGQRQDQFVAVIYAHQQRRAPRAKDRAVDPRFLLCPDRLARALVEPGQEGRLAWALMHNEQVLVENRAGAVPPFVQDGAQIAVPKLVASEVVGDNTDRSEVGIDGLAIGDRGAGARRILRVCRLGDGAGHVALPQQSAVRTLKRQDRPALALVQALREEDMISPDDRRRIAGLGQCDFPANVVVLAPGERQAALGGDPSALGATPRGPVVGTDRRDEAEKDKGDERASMAHANSS